MVARLFTNYPHLKIEMDARLHTQLGFTVDARLPIIAKNLKRILRPNIDLHCRAKVS
jgi:hypothetical protein